MHRFSPHSRLFVASSLRRCVAPSLLPRRRAFTLIEVLVTIAALIIIMGLAVSLAREVRRRSADGVTRELLTELETTIRRYQQQHAGTLPAVAPLISTPEPGDPATLGRAARRNNEDFVLAIRTGGGFIDELFAQLPRSMYDDQTLRDAWGSPIVFMPSMHPAIGMADDNRPFFVSAGPDGNYLTRDDNLYSYEGR
ncbi:MAG TPA: type II secretion system protein [Tepidisphaeraceae bacterium]|nr:type II secretion system protein [Tepidisphaeraceae bacterium]